MMRLPHRSPCPAVAAVLSRRSTLGMIVAVAFGVLLHSPIDLSAQAERFDRGRMWTFENLPTDWLEEEYGIRAEGRWLEQIRLGSLRLPGCSGSFVSPDGLILTNHHCIRDAVPTAAREGEDLLADGFSAASREEERSLPGFTVQQFVWSEDVTDRIDEVVGTEQGEKRAERLAEARADIEEETLERFAERFGGEENLDVEFVELWAGVRTSVYVWRRLDDVRLVMAPETSVGFFGGEVDNFEYPRWNLDIAFMRAWDGDEPYASPAWFEFSEFGVAEGDGVFVVGNPGSTSRWETPAQLAARRDVTDRSVLDFVRERADVIESFTTAWPERARASDVSNDLFSARNTAKSLEGSIAALEDPDFLGRLERRQQALLDLVVGDSIGTARLEVALARIDDAQERKRALEREYRAFLGLTAEGLASSTLHRTFLVWQVLNLRGQGAPVSYTADLMAAVDSVGSAPRELDEELLATRLESFVDIFGAEERWLLSMLRGRSPEGAATRILESTLMADSVATAEAIRTGRVDGNDPALRMVSLFAPTFRTFQAALSSARSQEDAAVQEILDVVLPYLPDEWGTPDATGSPRLSDGVVASFEAADGSTPPLSTDLGGLYRRAEERGGEADSPWNLPARWWDSRVDVDPTVPLNFVASADIAGGNSGSPVLTGGLELVGVVFDSPYESLPSGYLFDPEQHRTIAVDARAILHTLLVVYDMDQLVAELRGGAIAIR